MNRNAPLKNLFMLLLSLASVSMTARAEVPFVGAKCKPASDQIATFQSPLQKLPVPVLIDRAFTEDHRSRIIEATEEWNKFGEERLGTPIFKIEPLQNVSYGSLALGDAYCNLAPNSRFDGLLILRIDSQRKWEKFRTSDTAGAIQYRCSVGAKEKLSLFMMINTAQTTHELIKRVALHEFGHAIGLRHSCNPDSDSPIYRACKAVRRDHPYQEAIMNPVFDSHARGFHAPAQSLQHNDLERAYCLYQKYPFIR